MNKKIKEYFENKGMKIQNEMGYGIINGYETNLVVRVLDNQAPVLLHISTFIPNEKKEAILNTIKNMHVKMLMVDFTAYGLLIGLNDITIGKLIKRLDDILNSIYAILTDFGALTKEHCPVCGDVLPEDAAIHNVDGLQITLDEKCVEGINAAIEQANDEFEKAPNNRSRGFLGALIGALGGAVIYYILYLIGFISAISVVVGIFLGAKLYQKFGGKPDKIMIVIVTLVSFVVLLLTVFIIYVMASKGLVADYGFTSTGFKAFKDMMTVKEFKSSFISDLAMTVVFTIAGGILEAVDMARAIKRVDKVK